MKENKCIFHHWDGPSCHEGACVYQEQEYQARDAKEAQFGIDQMSKGYSKGYHTGLREGFARARYPEICHCHCCRSHGELC